MNIKSPPCPAVTSKEHTQTHKNMQYEHSVMRTRALDTCTRFMDQCSKKCSQHFGHVFGFLDHIYAPAHTSSSKGHSMSQPHAHPDHRGLSLPLHMDASTYMRACACVQVHSLEAMPCSKQTEQPAAIRLRRCSRMHHRQKATKC